MEEFVVTKSCYKTEEMFEPVSYKFAQIMNDLACFQRETELNSNILHWLIFCR